MDERQITLGLDATYSTAPAVEDQLREEIARHWGLPLGQRTEVCFKGGQRSAATGILELITSPDYPWNHREPLQLRISGLIFSTRDIERWTII